jgi:hypothetical protein
MRMLIMVAATCGLFLAFATSVTAADAKADGKIRVGGKPLSSGKVTFYLDNGQFVGSKIKDGEYTVDRLPVGTHRVTVEGEGVPLKYTLEDKSGLTVEVTEGAVTMDFDLK